MSFSRFHISPKHTSLRPAATTLQLTQDWTAVQGCGCMYGESNERGIIGRNLELIDNKFYSLNLPTC